MIHTINFSLVIKKHFFFPISNFPISASKERYGEVITTSLLKHSSSTTQMDPLKREQIRMRPTQYVCDWVSTLFEKISTILKLLYK